jgi:hypothetical protein
MNANETREVRPATAAGEHGVAWGVPGATGGCRKPSPIDEAVIRERLRVLALQTETAKCAQGRAGEGGLRKLLEKERKSDVVLPGFDGDKFSKVLYVATLWYVCLGH